MLTRTSEYALRAMIHLAVHGQDGPIPGAQIASETGVPRKYLSKILADLVRAGALEASPGKTGGFRLAMSPKKIRLFEVLTPFEPVLADRRPCPFGKEVCSDDDPCPGHDRWRHVRDTYSRFLHKTSIEDIAFAPSTKAPKPRSRRKRTKR